MTHPINFIKAKNTAQGRYILWQRGNYHYEIDCELGPNRARRIINLFDTGLEQAVEKFNELVGDEK
jgi:hypothetical protein